MLGDFQYRERQMTARNRVLRCDGLQSVLKLLLNWVPLAHGWKMGGGGLLQVGAVCAHGEHHEGVGE